MSLNPFDCSFDLDQGSDITNTINNNSSSLLSHQTPNVDESPSTSTSQPQQNPMPQFRIRRMHETDVSQVLEIWAENNLHEGTGTIQSFLRVDPNGFYVAVEMENAVSENEADSKRAITVSSKSDTKLLGEAIQSGLQNLSQTIIEFKKCTTRGTRRRYCRNSSSSSTSTSSDSFVDFDDGVVRKNESRILGMCTGAFIHPNIAFIGMYAVRPELHGKGIGKAMWRRMMEHVSDSNAGLYAVPEYLTMYRDQAGFKSPDTRLLFIYESDEHSPPNVDLLVSSIRGIEVCSISEQHYQMVAHYDAIVHGYSRLTLLANVFREPNTASFVAFDLEDDENPVQGYGCIRTNNIGKAMIGPLYANNDAVAELLMRRLFEALAQPFARGLLYMTLDSNPGGERIAEKLRLPKMEELPRLFRHKPYRDASWNQVYCIHTPNFSLL